MTQIEAIVQQYEKTILELQGRLAMAAAEIWQFMDKGELPNKSLAEANKKLEEKKEDQT